MKHGLVVLVVAVVVCLVTGAFVNQRNQARFAEQLSEQRVAWQAERAELLSALEQSRPRGGLKPVPISTTTSPAAPALVRLTPAEIIARLRSLRTSSAANHPTAVRQAVVWFDELLRCGPAALPAIREFLASGEDCDLDTSVLSAKPRDRVPLEFIAPASLRVGIFDVLRRMGGPDAQIMLADTLAVVTRGYEVSYLAAALQESAPDKYRELSVTVARRLLAAPTAAKEGSPLDRNHREYLFAVLSMFGDTGFAEQAQAQLVRADNQIDRAALRYLQETLGAQAVPLVEQAYQNPSLTNSASREPLARVALSFVGSDPRANEFYAQAINDPLLTKSHRKNLIEDLNEDGFADPKNLTERDLPLIQNRIALIERLAPSATDAVNAAAFQEAYKDLVNMRAKVAGQGSAKISSSAPAAR